MEVSESEVAIHLNIRSSCNLWLQEVIQCSACINSYPAQKAWSQIIIQLFAKGINNTTIQAYVCCSCTDSWGFFYILFGEFNSNPWSVQKQSSFFDILVVVVLAAQKLHTFLYVYLGVNVSVIVLLVVICHLSFIYCCEEAPHTAVHDSLKKVVCQLAGQEFSLSRTIHQSSHKLQETSACMIYKPAYPGLCWTCTLSIAPDAPTNYYGLICTVFMFSRHMEVC